MTPIEDQIKELIKQLNKDELLPPRAFRRNVEIYELVSYVNNISGCYLSGNLAPIKVFIRRCREYLVDNEIEVASKEYSDAVTSYLNKMEAFIDGKDI